MVKSLLGKCSIWKTVKAQVILNVHDVTMTFANLAQSLDSMACVNQAYHFLAIFEIADCVTKNETAFSWKSGVIDFKEMKKKMQASRALTGLSVASVVVIRR